MFYADWTVHFLVNPATTGKNKMWGFFIIKNVQKQIVSLQYQDQWKQHLSGWESTWNIHTAQSEDFADSSWFGPWGSWNEGFFFFLLKLLSADILCWYSIFVSLTFFNQENLSIHSHSDKFLK